MCLAMNLFPSASSSFEELEDEIVKLRAALKFYADPTTWSKVLTHPGDEGHHPHNTGSHLRLAPIELDHGEVARKALANGESSESSEMSEVPID